MAVKQDREQPADAEPQGKETLNDLVGEQVMRGLGRPPDLQRVQVRCLWEACYRVNVFVGDSVASARIASSYFIHANPEGRIITSNPAITKQYGA